MTLKQILMDGICSVCSANEYVLLAAMEEAKLNNSHCLIEATSNQVNQYGGYTSMTPKDFYEYALELAEKTGLPREKLILGGDHLGPLTWQDEPANAAMEKAEELVRAFAAAGFTKLHLDTSMRLGGDDPNARLSDEIIAARAVKLALAAQSALPPGGDIAYVIGSEVPIPGGAHGSEEDVSVTKPEEMLGTYGTFKKAFEKAGIDFGLVAALVVQPGVEFGDDSVIDYDREKAKSLVSALPEGICFEGHSTDYQTKKALNEMRGDGIKILKVGPALTYGLREALVALEAVSRECGGNPRYSAALEEAMLKNPENWIKHYHGSDSEKAIKRRFSYSDRCRYYLPDKAVSCAINGLINDINELSPPLSLISQYLPTVYAAIREGRCAEDAVSMVKARVKDYLMDYDKIIM